MSYSQSNDKYLFDKQKYMGNIIIRLEEEIRRFCVFFAERVVLSFAENSTPASTLFLEIIKFKFVK